MKWTSQFKIPLQTRNPSPTNPSLQVHSTSPLELSQVACIWQPPLWVSQGSISQTDKQTKNIVNIFLFEREILKCSIVGRFLEVYLSITNSALLFARQFIYNYEKSETFRRLRNRNEYCFKGKSGPQVIIVSYFAKWKLEKLWLYEIQFKLIFKVTIL